MIIHIPSKVASIPKVNRIIMQYARQNKIMLQHDSTIVWCSSNTKNATHHVSVIDYWLKDFGVIE